MTIIYMYICICICVYYKHKLCVDFEIKNDEMIDPISLSMKKKKIDIAFNLSYTFFMYFICSYMFLY